MVDMGSPLFQPADVPFTADRQQEHYDLDLNGELIKISAISMGNPHAVLWVDSIAQAPVASLGRQIEAHPRFPKGVNVSFAQIVDRSTIKLRVFERGVGETNACGSGACATAAAAIAQDLVDSTVNIQLTGGQLTIEWLGEGNSLMMSGPAEISFHGHIKL
jgi:diaminopimelate epimerase